MALLMSQTEFAARHKVGKSAVSNWKRRRLLVFAPDPDRPGKQLVDVELSDNLVRGSIDPTRGRPRAAEGQEGAAPQTEGIKPPAQLSGIEAARLDEMLERTRRRKIETEQLLGSLVSLAEYERRAGDMARLIRERTMGLIRQQSERLAAETDPRTIVSVLGEAFDALFNQLADEIEAEADTERQVDQALAAIDDADDAEVEDEAA